jgi:transcriptional regulator with XRE-family HTH domain
MKDVVFLRELGARLRDERKKAGLSQDALGTALGMKTSVGHSYVSRLESGRLKSVSLLVVVHYLQACKAAIGKFVLELAQSGAFGEAEQGMVVVDDKVKVEQAKRAKAKLLSEKRWEREAQDSVIVAQLWHEVGAAIQPLLAKEHPSRRLVAPYLEGVRSFYRAWKQAVRGAGNKDPTPDVQTAFDRIEQLGCQRLVPAAVRKMREVVFERLMAQGEGSQTLNTKH